MAIYLEELRRWLKNIKLRIKNKYYLAIDLGDSSGCHIIGYECNSKLVLDEVYRFKEYLFEDNGHLV